MKTILTIAVMSVALMGCNPQKYPTEKEMDALIDKCNSLNGTLRGDRIDRGEHMGEWTNLFCDWSTPPNPAEESTATDSTEETSTTESI